MFQNGSSKNLMEVDFLYFDLVKTLNIDRQKALKD